MHILSSTYLKDSLSKSSQKKRATPKTEALKKPICLKVVDSLASTTLPAEDPFPREEYAQASYVLSLVEDPLWKRVCGEILTLMGPVAAQLFQVQLGVPQDKTMDLYCQTEDMVPFLHTYQFVILAVLQRYFPFLQALKIIHRTQQVAH